MREATVRDGEVGDVMRAHALVAHDGVARLAGTLDRRRPVHLTASVAANVSGIVLVNELPFEPNETRLAELGS